MGLDDSLTEKVRRREALVALGSAAQHHRRPGRDPAAPSSRCRGLEHVRADQRRRRGALARHNAADSIYADAGGARAKLKLTKRSGGKGYLGAIALVVQS